MVSAILFLMILKLISAPTWCFVLAWGLLIVNANKVIIGIYKMGKENAKNE